MNTAEKIVNIKALIVRLEEIFEDYKKVIDGTEYYFRGLRGQMNDDLDSLRVKLAKERGE